MATFKNQFVLNSGTMSCCGASRAGCTCRVPGVLNAKAPHRMSNAELHASAIAHHAELQKRMAGGDDADDEDMVDNLLLPPGLHFNETNPQIVRGELPRMLVPPVMNFGGRDERGHSFDDTNGGAGSGAYGVDSEYGDAPPVDDRTEDERRTAEENRRRLGLTTNAQEPLIPPGLDEIIDATRNEQRERRVQFEERRQRHGGYVENVQSGDTPDLLIPPGENNLIGW